jgi:sialic acid synthase SpsE/mannose-6-phosphate isomerase-like protein (cupin superfamily)
MESFNFKDLFVLDLANNHQGSLEHGLKIIQECSEIVKKYKIKAAIKFQFRQLDTFVHPNHKVGSDNKHLPRFLSTQLSRQDWQILFDAVKDADMLTMCTPFDDESVPVITEMGFDIIKVASCSAKDWPLLETIANTFMPVIASTGGLEIKDVDNLTSFFDHRGVNYALMHCVSIYPIPTEHFNLNHIGTLKNRYKNSVIGWSTHENPNETVAVQIAIAKGAEMFERHIGVETDNIKLNAYSSTPAQLDSWFNAYQYAKDLCGFKDARPVTNLEKKSLNDLQRGIFLKKNIKKGKIIQREDVYFAMPFTDGQLSSEHWTEGMVSTLSIKKDAPLFPSEIGDIPTDDNKVLKDAIHEVKAMLNESYIVLDSKFNIEFSHHYGVKNFRETGALIIDCINREYCKKLIVVLPGQKHPSHYHKRKEESFQVLSGVFESEIDGHRRTLHPGEVALVQPGVWHKFWSKKGCIVEEISTTHYNNDSIYNDSKINNLKRSERKTVVEHWGRFELVDG